MFGKIVNSITSIFHIGNNTQINTINYDAKITTSIKRIDKDFLEGNIKQVFDDIDSLLEENNANQKIKYQLLVKKASFLFSVYKHNEAIALIGSIEKHYSQFIDVSFEEIKLIKLSLEQNEEDFFSLVDKIFAETNKSLKKEKFEVMYYLNVGDIPKAKDIFIKNDFKKESIELLLLGGHIFSSLSEHKQASFYYQKALEKDISFLDRHVILSYHGTEIINKRLYGHKLSDDYVDNLKLYQESIEKILSQKEYFDELYITNLINNYMYTIMLLDDDKERYIKVYEENCSNEIIYTHHYFQYLGLKEAEINHEEIQQKILDENIELLFQYLHVFKNKDSANEVIEFLDKNKEYIYQNEYTLMFFIEYKLKMNSIIDNAVLEYLKEHKLDNIEYLISFMRVGDNVTEQDIIELIKFVNQENLILIRVIEVIDILKNIGRKKEYLDLAIDKQEAFEDTISHTLKLCAEDENLLQNEFDLFVSQINNLSTKYEWIILIANQYVKFNNSPKSFELYLQCIEEVANKKDLLFKVLEISLNYYIRTKDYIDKEKQKWIYNQLIAQKENMGTNELIFLFQYSLIVISDTRQILPSLNKNLLEQDINLIEHQTKIDLSNLFTQTQFGEFNSNYEKLFIYDENVAYVKDGKTYITNYTVNELNYGFEVVDDNIFFAIKNDSSYQKESLFHRIIGPFAFKVDNPNMYQLKVDFSKDNILEQMTFFIKEKFGDDKENFEAYTNQEIYGLFNLAKKDYANYFTLIPYLLNHDKYRLISLHPNLLVDKKKILTLSSIIFLNDLGYLDEALETKNIYIQQTLINWLKKYIEDFNASRRPQDFTYLDETKPKFIPFTQKEVDEAEKFKSELLSLYGKLYKCNIIDDTTENLPIAGAYDMLASKMGILEYHAISYCINHDYQIISENNIFEMLFDTLQYNKLFITNSFSLLANILSESNLFNVQKSLFEQGYQYLSNCSAMDKIIEGLYYHPILTEMTDDRLKVTFKILYEYGCLDELIKKYTHEYKVLYPKKSLPIKTIFSTNMEYLLDILSVSKE